jgi:hypothetical protein
MAWMAQRSIGAVLLGKPTILCSAFNSCRMACFVLALLRRFISLCGCFRSLRSIALPQALLETKGKLCFPSDGEPISYDEKRSSSALQLMYGILMLRCDKGSCNAFTPLIILVSAL